MATSDDLNLDAIEKRSAFPVHKEGFTIDDYQLIVRIGEGSFGEVWKAERGGYPVALKILNASINTEEAQRELKSLETLKQLHHKFLVHTENFWSDGDRLYIEMELADGGTLKERLKAYQSLGKEGIPADELLKYFTESAQALDYLHGNRPVFLHRDIKPANILLVQSCAKLADFGLLRQVTGDNTSTKTQGGTPVYMAPESVKEDKFSVASDLWSFAVTYAELRQGRLPFSAKTQFQIFQRVCQDPPDLDDVFHPEEKKVLLKALEKDPKDRFSSCGDFVFELNRVVPWTAAVVVPALPMPEQIERKPGSTKPKGPLPAAPQSAAPAPTDPSTRRKRAVPTMEDITLPPSDVHGANAPTVPNDDGTLVNEKLRRSDKPARTESQPDQGATVVPPSAPAGTKANPSSATDKKPTATYMPPARPQPKKSAAPRIVVSALVFAVFAGVGFVVFKELQGKKDTPLDKGHQATGQSPEAVAAAVEKALRDDDLEKARAVVDQNRKALPDAGEKLLARIDQKANALDLLQSAETLLKKQDFEGSLALLKKANSNFEFPADTDRKTSLLASARDGLHTRLVGAMRDAIKSRKTEQIRDSFAELSKFRDNHPSSDWTPNFQELPPPNDLKANAWNSLLADKVVAAEARRRLDELKDYANPKQPEKFVLDPAYEGNVVVIEALVKAHESEAANWDAASKELADASRLATSPPLSQNFWAALSSFEKGSKRFRFKDLEMLPPAPTDESTKQATARFFGLVLERLAQHDNYQWLPSDAEMKKIRVWLADFKGPGDVALALKAETLVREAASGQELARVDFPADRDWYTRYVSALVVEKTQGAPAAATALAAILKDRAAVRKERMKDAGRVLRGAVASLAPKGGASREFATKEDATKAFPWLTALLEQEETAPLRDLLDLTAAAIQAGTREADARLETLPGELDKLPEVDKLEGYRVAAKTFRADFDAAAARKDFGDRALPKSERAQSFASKMRKDDLLLDAAELNARAVEFAAQATFAKAKDAHAKYQIFAEAIKKAQSPPKLPAGFSLPLVVAMLESAKDFSRNDMDGAIQQAEKALEVKLPAQKEWEAIRGKAMVRVADLRYSLLFKKVEAKERIEPGVEYPIILDLYLKARTAYRENYAGELGFKIGRLYVLLEDFRKAYDELKVARTKLAAIPQPYAEDRRAEITDAIRLTEGLMNTPELKAFVK
jgi:serine/threonine protein kinase